MTESVCKKVQVEVINYFNCHKGLYDECNVTLRKNVVDISFPEGRIISMAVLNYLISVAKKFDQLYYIHEAFGNCGLVFTIH